MRFVVLAALLAMGCGGATTASRASGPDAGAASEAADAASTDDDATAPPTRWDIPLPPDASPGATTEADGAACPVIVASNYDQTCQKDGDCVGIVVGDACLNRCGQPSAAVNVPSYLEYENDISFSVGLGPCGPVTSPLPTCCLSGLCAIGSGCMLNPADVDAAVCPDAEVLCPVGCTNKVQCQAPRGAPLPPCPPPPPCPQ